MEGEHSLSIFSILFYLLVGLTILAIILAIRISPQYYWLGAFTSYIISFLGGFSIGLYTLSITFIFLALALAHTMKWIKNPLHSILIILAASIIWVISALTIDDYWLFLPFMIII